MYCHSSADRRRAPYTNTHFHDSRPSDFAQAGYSILHPWLRVEPPIQVKKCGGRETGGKEGEWRLKEKRRKGPETGGNK